MGVVGEERDRVKRGQGKVTGGGKEDGNDANGDEDERRTAVRIC
jgi:hypothetical protein